MVNNGRGYLSGCRGFNCKLPEYDADHAPVFCFSPLYGEIRPGSFLGILHRQFF